MNATAHEPAGIKGSGAAKYYPKISLTGNFIIYVIVFVAALIFTQALRSKASNIFFTFVLFLPWVMLIYALTARSTLKTYLLSDSATIYKLEPYTYRLRILNESILPYPFIDAILHLPQSSSVRCTDRLVSLAMSPLASYTINNTVRFRFRGTYEIGVRCLYVYDFFRMLRIRVDVGMYDSVSVLPRRLVMGQSEESAVSDSARETKKDPYSYEKIEISDIREYMIGDPLKSIHWKLSSKADDFLVRDYDTGSSKQTLVFCDLSARFPTEPPERAEEKAPAKKKKPGNQAGNGSSEGQEASGAGNGADGLAEGDATESMREPDAAAEKETREMARGRKGKKKTKAARRRKGTDAGDAGELQNNGMQVDINELADDSYYDDMNEYCADGVVELTVAVVLRELRDNNECTLFWFDRRSESGVYSFTLRGIEDFNAIYCLFATAPLCPAEETVARISRMVEDTQDTKQIFITAAIDPDSVRELCSLPNISDGAAWGASAVILYNPEERFAHISERKLYIESCRSQLMLRGLRLVEGRLDQKLRLE
jgi:hypothetical protein